MKHLESPETRTADAYHPRLHACTATRADGRHRNGVLLPARCSWPTDWPLDAHVFLPEHHRYLGGDISLVI